MMNAFDQAIEILCDVGWDIRKHPYVKHMSIETDSKGGEIVFTVLHKGEMRDFILSLKEYDVVF